MKYKITATENGVISKTDAPAVMRELRAIARTNRGALPPENVVESAKQRSSPLHQYFTWDDGEAARKQRLHEARELVRSISVTIIENENKEPYTVRAFVNVRAKEGEQRFNDNAYLETSVALRDTNYREQLVRRAYAEAISWKERYEHLKEFSAVVEAIEHIHQPQVNH